MMFSDRTNWKLAQNRFTRAVEEVRATGAKILDLTASNPTRVGLEYDSQAILAALGSSRSLDYDPQAKGLRSAREAVAGYYRADHGVDVDPERVILTTSTSEGYSYVFRLLCNAGDELLVPKPSYPLFEFLADLQDVKLVAYPLIYDHAWQMDFHSLERAVTERTRGVVLVHPNNPTGSYVSESEQRQLNEFCRERGLAVVVDEVFVDYGLDIGHVGTAALGRPVERSSTLSNVSPEGFGKVTASAVPSSATEDTGFSRWGDQIGDAVELRSTGPIRRASLAQGRLSKAAVPTRALPRASFAGNLDVLTFTLSGLSKIAALPQMKVAWVVTSGPENEVAAAMARLEVIADTYLSMNAPVQWAVPTLMEQRKSIQRQLLERVKRNLAELDRQLAGQKACQRLEVQGGWYAVLRVPVTRSDEELAIELVREKRVLVHPGHFYDFARDGYLVVSLIGEEGEFGEGIRSALEYLSF